MRIELVLKEWFKASFVKECLLRDGKVEGSVKLWRWMRATETKDSNFLALGGHNQHLEKEGYWLPACGIRILILYLIPL
jgi:hypothetical protein